MTATLNGTDRTRKSLGAQIDRLDSTLDGLADNLNDAVAQAVKEAVGTAVREAVAAVFGELLSNPKVLTLFRDGIRAAVREEMLAQAKSTRPAAPRGSWTQAAGARFTRFMQAIGLVALSSAQAIRQLGRDSFFQARRQATRLAQQASQQLQTARRGMGYLRYFKTQLLTAMGTGIALGTAAFFSQPWVAAALSGLGGVGLALAVQAGWRLHRMFTSSTSIC